MTAIGAPRTARSRMRAAALACGLGLGVVRAAAGGTLDPALAALARGGAPEPVLVWVEFRDKAVPAEERAAALARAAAALTPRARARRLRAGLNPLVDERDLPVPPADLAALARLGVQPFAVSRWLDHAAAWVSPARLADVAALPRVARVRPVPGAGAAAASPVGARPAALRHDVPAGVTALHGLLEPQLAQLGIPAMHDSSYRGAGVLIAVLDDGFTGIDRHEALRGLSFAPGHRRDFIVGDSIVTGRDFAAHGTKVLGCIAASVPGVYVGAAPAADFALARTENDFAEQRAEMLYWAQAAEWADSLGADIISSSLGYSTFDPPDPSLTYGDLDGHTADITRAAEIAASKGILVVNAVGNEGDKPWHWLLAPADANGDSVLAIGAVDLSGAVAPFSSFGPTADGRIKPDLAACGVDVPTLDPFADADYQTDSGTSVAAPLISGLAACLMQARPAWSAVDVIHALKQTGSRVYDPDLRVGWGTPDGLLALTGMPRAAFTERLQLGVAIEGAQPVTTAPVTALVALGTNEPAARVARVRVFDLTGRAVADLGTFTLLPGRPVRVAWDARTRAGHPAPAGVYWISAEAAGLVGTARAVMVR